MVLSVSVLSLAAVMEYTLRVNKISLDELGLSQH